MNTRKEGKRPRDANQPAKFIGDVATGKQASSLEVDPINTIAQTGGLRGGKVRADKLSAERRQEIAVMHRIRLLVKEKVDALVVLVEERPHMCLSTPTPLYHVESLPGGVCIIRHSPTSVRFPHPTFPSRDSVPLRTKNRPGRTRLMVSGF